MSDVRHETVGIEELVSRARAGEAEAENVLFAHLHARVLHVAKRRVWDPEAAEDIAQETLQTAFEKYRGADLSRGFFPWLFTILHHKVGNYLKRRRSEDARLAPGAALWQGDWEALASAPDGDAAYIELVDCLEKAMQRLSPDCRVIFRLLLAGAGRREIRAAFGHEPIGTVDSRMSRCRASLLAQMENLTAARRRP